jgi:predicted Rossmann fold nucleotide-binding protein DprA/Smf involved in DNA uptake
MKTAVIGSRGFSDYDLLKQTLDACFISEIVSGGAIGADQMAERYAEELKIPTLIFKPDYNKYGRGAPLVRNKEIVDAAERVIAFWDGKSRGTAYTLKYARSKGKEVKVISFTP